MSSSDFRASAHRAARIAKNISSDLQAAGLGKQPAPATDSALGDATFDEIVDDDDLRAACRPLYMDGHYAQAVLEAYKCLNNFVKAATSQGADGASLMTHVFSAKSPLLAINSLANQSDRDEQTGYMRIFEGVMQGIRNPRAHEQFADDPAIALELLALANHLMRMARRAEPQSQTGS